MSLGHRRAAVVDRDGTIVAERHYLSDPDQLELLPGALEGLRELREQGFDLVVVTNQSGLSRGYFDQARLDQIHARLEAELAAGGVRLDAIFVCPHLPSANCECRKPRPGLLHAAAARLGFDPRAALVVGDKECDIALGQAVGATTFLVQTGYGAETAARAEVQPDFVVPDLAAVAQLASLSL
jgi:D-glycero-D-manno-heptose 1,7-bisphosphate phosphatase